jgi:hypothetical protein
LKWIIIITINHKFFGLPHSPQNLC